MMSAAREFEAFGVEESLRANYRASPEITIQADEAFRSLQQSPIERFGAGCFSLLGIFFGVEMVALYVRYKPERRPPSGAVLMGLVIGAAGLYYLFLRRPMRRRSIRRRHDLSILADSEVEWTIGPDRLSVRTSHSEESFRWPLIERVAETATGFLVFTNRFSAYWIPHQAFASPDGPDRFAKLAEARVARYDVLKPGRPNVSKPVKTMDDEL